MVRAGHQNLEAAVAFLADAFWGVLRYPTRTPAAGAQVFMGSCTMGGASANHTRGVKGNGGAAAASAVSAAGGRTSSTLEYDGTLHYYCTVFHRARSVTLVCFSSTSKLYSGRVRVSTCGLFMRNSSLALLLHVDVNRRLGWRARARSTKKRTKATPPDC